MDEHGYEDIDDGGTAENDGHDGGGGGAFHGDGGGPEGEDEGEGTEGTGDTSDEAPSDACAGEAEVRSTGFEDEDGADHGDKEVGDAYPKKGFQASVGGLGTCGHLASAVVKNDAVSAPRKYGEVCV